MRQSNPVGKKLMQRSCLVSYGKKDGLEGEGHIHDREAQVKLLITIIDEKTS